MGTLSLTDPVNGTTADATLIATNNASIKTVVNGGIDNTNISSGAAIAASKLAAYPSDATKFLAGDGTWVVPSGNPTTYRKTTTKAVNTTVSATDLLNAEITIAAGAMGSNKLARLHAWGDWLQNSGGTAAAPRFQVVLGSTTMIDTGASGSTATAASATRYGWEIDVDILNTASNAQVCTFRIVLPNDTNSAWAASPATGSGGILSPLAGATAVATGAITNSGLAVDTSSAVALKLNVINGSSSASYETKLFGALVQIL